MRAGGAAAEPASWRWWGAGTGALASAISYMFLSRSLFFGGRVLVGALCGVAAGLTVRRHGDAAVAAGAVTFVLSAAMPPWFTAQTGSDAQLGAALVLATLAAATAFGLSWVSAWATEGGWGGASARTARTARTARQSEGRSGYLRLLSWAVLGALVAVFWANAVALASRADPPYAPWLAQVAREPVAGEYAFDGSIYRRAFYLMHRGQGYYAAMRRSFVDDSRFESAPTSPLNYRMPTLWWIWRSLPPDGLYIEYLWLALAAGAMAAAFWAASRVVAPGPALLAPIGLSTHLLYPAVSQWLPFPEFWGGALAVVCAAAVAASAGSVRPSKRWFEAGAVGIATLAASVREHLVYLLVAGIAASLAAAGRRAGALWWVGGLAVFGAAVWLHVSAVSRMVGTPAAAGLHFSAWLHGGPAHLAATARFSQALVAQPAWFPLVVAVLGAAGALAARPRRLAVFLSVAVLSPVAAFLVFGTAEAASAYWGAVWVPMLLLTLPMAFAWLPGMRAQGIAEEGAAT